MTQVIYTIDEASQYERFVEWKGQKMVVFIFHSTEHNREWVMYEPKKKTALFWFLR